MIGLRIKAQARSPDRTAKSSQFPDAGEEEENRERRERRENGRLQRQARHVRRRKDAEESDLALRNHYF
jgi:hypothetical protein